jgi:hypothetical protein
MPIGFRPTTLAQLGSQATTRPAACENLAPHPSPPPHPVFRRENRNEIPQPSGWLAPPAGSALPHARDPEHPTSGTAANLVTRGAHTEGLHCSFVLPITQTLGKVGVDRAPSEGGWPLQRSLRGQRATREHNRAPCGSFLFRLLRREMHAFPPHQGVAGGAAESGSRRDAAGARVGGPPVDQTRLETAAGVSSIHEIGPCLGTNNSIPTTLAAVPSHLLSHHTLLHSSSSRLMLTLMRIVLRALPTDRRP